MAATEVYKLHQFTRCTLEMFVQDQVKQNQGNVLYKNRASNATSDSGNNLEKLQYVVFDSEY